MEGYYNPSFFLYMMKENLFFVEFVREDELVPGELLNSKYSVEEDAQVITDGQICF